MRQALVAITLEDPVKRPRRKAKPKLSAPAVYGKTNGRRRAEPICRDVEAFMLKHGLLPAASLAPGERVIHLTRNLVNRADQPGSAFRATMHSCQVVEMLPSRVRVRFETGAEKVVKQDSLYLPRKENNSNEM